MRPSRIIGEMPQNEASFTVNASVVDVPVSAVAALKCMRNAERTRIVWTDSICINQADLNERAYQVAVMADIYKSAKGNLIYLGEIDELTRRGFELVDRLYDEISRKTLGFSKFYDLIQQRSRGSSYSIENIECQLDESALCCIFKRPWFQ